MPHNQPVHHRLDGVHLVAIQLDLFIHVTHLAVDPHPDIAQLAHVIEHLAVLPFAGLDERGQKHDAAALRHLLNGLHDLAHGLLVYLAATAVAVGNTDTGV